MIDAAGFQALVDNLTGTEMIQWLVEHPAEVESILIGSDWSDTPADVVRMMQQIHDGQQTVLARGGGRLSFELTDDTGTRRYSALL